MISLTFHLMPQKFMEKVRRNLLSYKSSSLRNNMLIKSCMLVLFQLTTLERKIDFLEAKVSKGEDDPNQPPPPPSDL